ncbi:MAG: esterase-like activity of phytase family protein [Burkholderiales bacterium]
MHQRSKSEALPTARIADATADAELLAPMERQHGGACNGTAFALTRRRWLAATGATLLAAQAGCSARANDTRDGRRAASTKALRLLGSATLPYRLSFLRTTVGGLSGLDYDSANDLWFAISDDGWPPRYYTLHIPFSEQGMPVPRLTSVVGMAQANGVLYPRRGPGRLVCDPESIRFRPSTRTLLWTSEGDRHRGVDPFLREMTTSGRHLREFRLPAHFHMNPDGNTGPRKNGAFEGLALTTDGGGAWVAMENPLLQDGPEAGVDDPGAPCRFTLFDLASGNPLHQIAYRPEKIARVPIPGLAFADNGVSEILMLDSHRMLVLERGFSVGAGVSLRLYMIDVRSASDTLGLETLRGAPVRLAPKTLVADFDDLGLARLDNTEGMAWGPRLPASGGQPGQRTLVFVSDDNFNPLQITQFAAFAFTDPGTHAPPAPLLPEPARA